MSHIWLFGYGSLIWRPDLEFRDRAKARVHGWTRRFWQGSHDHRGLPHAPGRVVTLIPSDSAHCDGMAYLIDEGVADKTFEQLDHREKNGYEKHEIGLQFDNGERHPGVVYIAQRDNHAYLGPAPMDALAKQVLGAAGPSGRNIDYVLELARALRQLDIDDQHVFELERLLNANGGKPG